MKVYELISSMNAIENEINYLEEKLHASNIIMSEMEVNEVIEKIECLNNQYHEMLNSDVEYSLPKSNTAINLTQPTITDSTKFLNELVNRLNRSSKQELY